MSIISLYSKTDIFYYSHIFHYFSLQFLPTDQSFVAFYSQMAGNSDKNDFNRDLIKHS